MLNKKGFTYVEVMIVVAIACLLCAIAIPNVLRFKDLRQNNKRLQQNEEFDNRYGEEVEIKNNRFIVIPHNDHWGGKRIRVDTIRDTNTGKSYIIFRGYNGITALEIK